MRRPLFCLWQQNVVGLTQQQRQQTLENLELTSDKAIPIFDETTQTVANTLNLPVVMLGIVVGQEYCLKSAYGLSNLGLMNPLAVTRKISTQEAFATNVIDSCNCLIIDDVLNDAFFSHSDLCQVYGVSAYVGVPLMSSDGVCFGCLEVVDTQPRQFTVTEINYLMITARWCMAEYERNQLLNYSKNSFQSFPAESYILEDSKSVEEDSYLKQLTFMLLNKLIGKLSIPLTSVVGMSSVLKQEIYGKLNPKQSEYIQIIHNSGQEVSYLVDEITQISNTENELKLEYIPVDLENLGQQVIASLQSMANSREQSLRLSIEPGKKVWRLDREKVKKTIYYLLICIIESSRTGGEIHIHISQRGDRLSINCRVDHPWLGDGISLEKVNWYQKILKYDEQNNLLVKNSLAVIKDQNPEYDLICLLFSAYLANLQKGTIQLRGSIESGHRFTLSVPIS